MNKKSVAVITKDKMLFELFSTEAQYWGFEIKCFSTIYGLSEFFDKYFFDADTVSDDVSFIEAEVIIMSRTHGTLKKFDGYSVLLLPLSLSELAQLLNNVESVNARHKDDDVSETQFYCDKKAKILFYGGKSEMLSENEFLVLERLCQSKGNAVSHEELNMVLDADKGNISDVYVCHLRRKFETICNNRVIKTVRSKGYVLDIHILIK